MPENGSKRRLVIARERVSEAGDDLKSFEGLGQASPLLAWPMTIAMLALAGFPATAGFIGKFYLIDAAVAGDYAWLGVLIVVGSRNLAHFDAALVAYTFAVLFATFGLTYRYAMWLMRPPTAVYWRRGWQAFFRRAGPAGKAN